MIKWHKDGKRNYAQNEGVLCRLPRLYREKLFSKPLREQLAADAIDAGDTAYWDEVQRLDRLVENPRDYYDERERYNHDVITSKINQFNQF